MQERRWRRTHAPSLPIAAISLAVTFPLVACGADDVGPGDTTPTIEGVTLDVPGTSEVR